MENIIFNNNRIYKPKLKKGDIFNNLKAVKYLRHDYRKSHGGTSVWLFECKCGRFAEIKDINVRSGHTKSCTKGCHKYLGKGISLENKLYSAYKRNALKRNLEFNITKDNFIKLTKLNCEYCEKEPSQLYRMKSTISTEPSLLYNGIDRKNNNKGYTLDNCKPCCKTCNFAKNNLSYDEFIDWLSRIVKHNRFLFL